MVADRFAALLDDWRLSLGLNNRDFARYLGRSKSEWSLVQRGERHVTKALAAASLAKAREPWRSALATALADDLANQAPPDDPSGTTAG